MKLDLPKLLAKKFLQTLQLSPTYTKPFAIRPIKTFVRAIINVLKQRLHGSVIAIGFTNQHSISMIL